MKTKKRSTDKESIRYFSYEKWLLAYGFNPYMQTQNLSCISQYQNKRMVKSPEHSTAKEAIYVCEDDNTFTVPSCLTKKSQRPVDFDDANVLSEPLRRLVDTANWEFCSNILKNHPDFQTVAYITNNDDLHQVAIVQICADQPTTNNKCQYAYPRYRIKRPTEKWKTEVAGNLFQSILREEYRLFPNGSLNSDEAHTQVYLMPLHCIADVLQKITTVTIPEEYRFSESVTDDNIAERSEKMFNCFVQALTVEQECSIKHRQNSTVRQTRESELRARYSWMNPAALNTLIEADFQYSFAKDVFYDYAGILVLFAKALELQIKSMLPRKLREEQYTFDEAFDCFIRLYPYYSVHNTRYIKEHIIMQRNKGAHEITINRSTIKDIHHRLFVDDLLSSFRGKENRQP